jgi:hypothetical protein
MTVIPAIGRLKQEDHIEFRASLGYVAGPCLQTHMLVSEKLLFFFF